MKIQINLILLIFILFAAVLFYQHKLQYDSEDALRKFLLIEWDERKKTEDAIKNEVASKISGKEFVMQLDYQRQLEEELNFRFRRLEENFTSFKSDLESLVNLKLNDYENRVLRIIDEFESERKRMLGVLDLIEARRNELQATFSQRLELNENNLKKYIMQNEHLKQEIRKLNKQQAHLEALIKEYGVRSILE